MKKNLTSCLPNLLNMCFIRNSRSNASHPDKPHLSNNPVIHDGGNQLSYGHQNFIQLYADF